MVNYLTMTDSLFSSKKKNVFVKTYSKVRPLQTFIPDFPSFFKHAGGALSTIHSGKPLQCVLSTSVAPTLAPANSPSSDSSSSEHLDIEMIPSEVEKSATEEEDEKTFVTLTPGSKNSIKKQNKKRSSTPLQNVSNVIKVIHPNKTVPKRTGSPFMWTSTKVRPLAQLDSIQESDQESSSGDESECVMDNRDIKQKDAASTTKNDASGSSKDAKDVEMKDCQDMRGGVKKMNCQNRSRSKHLPLFVQGRGVFSSDYCSRRGPEQSSTQMFGSTAYTDDFSTHTAYTGESEETSDDSTLMTSDTGSRYSTVTDTFKEEDFSDIEIPRDVPGPTVRVMKQLTPRVAQLVLPDASVRTTQRKSAVHATKAMPRTVSSAWHNKKATTGRKNSTLLEDLSALNIQEYGPIQEISNISEETVGPDFVSSKITSTPTSKDRNTVIHHRFTADVSSIDGDACALPTIEAMPSFSSTLFTDSNKPSSTCPRTGVIHAPVPAEMPVSTARSVNFSAGSDSIGAPLSIKGKKALTIERASPRMSPRVSFRQYPKSASSVIRNNTTVVSAGSMSGNLSRNGSSSSNKQVKFLLSTKVKEVLPDSNVSCAVVYLPELSPSSSILKKRGSQAANETSTVLTKEDTVRPSSNKENGGGRPRMTSTPQRQSRKTKGAHMLQLSFDVSAVDLPSCSDDDLVIQTSTQTKSKTTAEVANKEKTCTVTGQSTQELMDFDPEPMQLSMSVTNEPLNPATHTYEEAQQGSLQEVQHPVHATPKVQLKRSSPSSDLPGRPNKKRILEKWKMDSSRRSSEESIPQTVDRATQKNLPRQKKRLEYADKAVGLPECIISRLGPSPLKPAKFWQYVSNDVQDYGRIKNMPQDIMETIPDAVFS